MKLTILVEQDIEIPDDAIPGLIQGVRGRFESEPGAKCHWEDIATQAMIDGLVERPESGWTVAAQHDEWLTEDDL